jgi:hypothetical protein
MIAGGAGKAYGKFTWRAFLAISSASAADLCRGQGEGGEKQRGRTVGREGDRGGEERQGRRGETGQERRDRVGKVGEERQDR